MDDRLIVQMYLDRDENAIRESENKYARYLHSVAYRLLNDLSDTEECVNDTWLGAWNSIPPNKPEDLRTYFAKITRRLSIDRIRSRMADKRGKGEYALSIEELEECISGGDDPVAHEVEAKDLSQAVDRFLRTLPETQRIIFMRRYWFAEPMAEIAERFGFKETRVRTLLFRARMKLRTYLEEEGYYHG